MALRLEISGHLHWQVEFDLLTWQEWTIRSDSQPNSMIVWPWKLARCPGSWFSILSLYVYSLVVPCFMGSLLNCFLNHRVTGQNCALQIRFSPQTCFICACSILKIGKFYIKRNILASLENSEHLATLSCCPYMQQSAGPEKHLPLLVRMSLLKIATFSITPCSFTHIHTSIHIRGHTFCVSALGLP